MFPEDTHSFGNLRLLRETFGTMQISQMCMCGARKKKKLLERLHICGCGVSAQRDVLSAYLGLLVDTGTTAPDGVGEFTAHKTDRQLLQANWQNALKED